MQTVRIRQARLADHAALVAMRTALWPNGADEHAAELFAVLGDHPVGTLPTATLVAEATYPAAESESGGGPLLGFVDVGLRSHADGCDPARPVGYVEGWFVVPEARRSGVGRALVKAAEDWSRAQGCTEMASDTWIDNAGSQQAHEALGFEVVDRCVHYRKPL